jgi:ferredoxin
VLRVVLLCLAVFLIFCGLFGPQFAPKNLATLFVWVHYRGLLILGLILAGNLFCAGCPLVLARNIGRIFKKPTRNWPPVLRNKLLAISFFVGFLFAYEYFDLWASPFYTALLIAFLFALVLIVDLTFTNASFCKYVCPIGQFNFVGGLLSPLEIRPKNAEVCRTCTTLSCLKGRPSQRGCELKLLVPNKTGNFDCTMCMDCVRACEYDNVIVGRVTPGHVLFEKNESPQPGLGRLWHRKDIAALIIAFTFGALLNAFAMIGVSYHYPLLLQFALFLVVAPALLLGGATMLSRRDNFFELLPALIPLGVGIWAAHYSFHFFTGALTFLPLIVPADPGFWSKIPLGVPDRIVLPAQIGLLILFGMIALVTAHRRARRHTWPWYAVILVLTIAAAYILTQPMDMRGTFVG